MIIYPKKVNKNLYKHKDTNLKTFYGLEKNIIFCKKCTYSNQKPTSEKEFKHNIKTKKTTLSIGFDGICSACKIAEKKENNIDWIERERQLKNLCNKYRSKNGNYDCLVPGSGGKDSFYQAYKLKYEYGMNPLTITWAPHIYTSWGWQNFQSWIHAGFDNCLFTPNGRAHRLLTRLALDKIYHPFQPFIMGQNHYPARAAAKQYNIKLIFYGDSNAEYGNADNYNIPSKNIKYFSSSKEEELMIAGTSIKELKKKYLLTDQDLLPYLPISKKELKTSKVDVQYLGYYLPWRPQECYYFSVENGNFIAAPERTLGTYSKYNSIDDKMDDFHYYTLFIKFGIGRASYEAAQDIRNKEITRQEGIKLVNKFDGEYPARFEKEIFEYLSINNKQYSKKVVDLFEQPKMEKKYFEDLTNKFRSPHIWYTKNNKWYLRKKISIK